MHGILSREPGLVIQRNVSKMEEELETLDRETEREKKTTETENKKLK